MRIERLFRRPRSASGLKGSSRCDPSQYPRAHVQFSRQCRALKAHQQPSLGAIMPQKGAAMLVRTICTEVKTATSPKVSPRSRCLTKIKGWVPHRCQTGSYSILSTAYSFMSCFQLHSLHDENLVLALLSRVMVHICPTGGLPTSRIRFPNKQGRRYAQLLKMWPPVCRNYTWIVLIPHGAAEVQGEETSRNQLTVHSLDLGC